MVDPEFSTLHQLVFSLNPAIFDENRPESASQQETQSLTWYTASQPLFQVVDLMRKCLALDCTRRITALDALKHPFFQEHTS